MTDHMNKILEYRKACALARVESEDLDLTEEEYEELLAEYRARAPAMEHHTQPFVRGRKLGVLFSITLRGA